jgi:hypothetical protein
VLLNFWHELHDFIECNMNKFVGFNNDGNDAIFQYPWGQMNHLKKRVILQRVGQDL